MDLQSKLKIGGLGYNPSVLNQPKKSNVFSNYNFPNTKPVESSGITVGNKPLMTQPLGNERGFINPSKDTQINSINQLKPKNPLADFGSGNKDVKSITTNPDGTKKIDLYSDNKTTTPPATDTTSTELKDPYSNPATGASTYKSSPGFVPPPISNSPPQDTPPAIDTKSNAERVIGSGEQTPLEKQAYEQLLKYGTGYESPQVAKARQDLLDAQNQIQAQTRGINTSGTWTSRALGEQGQANIQNANILANLQGALSSAYSSQGQQIGALGTAQGGAQTQAQRAQGGAGTVFSAGLVSPTTPGQATFSGLSGYQGGSTNGTGANINQFGDPNDPKTKSNYDAYINYYDKYNAGLGGINTATASEPGIINTLIQFGLNNQPLSAITNLNELLAGQTSNPGQQQLATQVANYIKQLGIDPATLTSSIASQQSGTLVQLLYNLKEVATKNNDANKTTADSLKTKSTSSSTSSNRSSGDFSWDFLKGLN